MKLSPLSLALLVLFDGATALLGTLATRKPLALAPVRSRGALAACRALAADAGGGGGGGGAIDSGGGGGDGGDDESETDVPTLLAESGLDAESIPLDVLDALKAGRIGALELANWKAVLANPLTKLLAGMAYIRNRLLADPRLPSVLGIELGVGVCAVFAAEKAARRERFFKELDFVIANQVLICLTNIALVLALTPTAAIAAPAAAGSLAAYMASLPGYFLQEGSFSAGQRAACFFSKAAQFSVVGSMTAAAGQGVTKGLVAMRTALNPESPPEGAMACEPAHASSRDLPACGRLQRLDPHPCALGHVDALAQRHPTYPCLRWWQLSSRQSWRPRRHTQCLWRARRTPVTSFSTRSRGSCSPRCPVAPLPRTSSLPSFGALRTDRCSVLPPVTRAHLGL